MIPEDTPFITITAHLECFGMFVCEVHGKAYALDNEPKLDVVTWVNDQDEEYEMAGPYGTPPEDAIHDALWKEARSPLALSRLQEAFEDYHVRSRLAAQGDHLRVVAAE